MFDDVTDDMCQGGLLIALPSKVIRTLVSTRSCEARRGGGRGLTVGRAPEAAPSTLDAGVQLACWRAGRGYIRD